MLLLLLFAEALCAEHVDLVAADADVHGLLRVLGEAARTGVVASGDVGGLVRGRSRHADAHAAIEHVAREVGAYDRHTDRWHVLVSDLWAPLTAPRPGPDADWSACAADDEATSATPLPPPGPARTGRGKPLSVDLERVETRTFLRFLANFANVTVVLDHEALAGTLTIRAKDMPWDEVLGAALESRGLVSACRDRVVVVWDPARESAAPWQPWAALREGIQVVPRPGPSADELRAELAKATERVVTASPNDSTQLVLEGHVLSVVSSRGVPDTDAPAVTPVSPLQRWEADAFRLTATFGPPSTRLALLADPDGGNHVVGVGTYVGKSWGKVRDIGEDALQVVETFEAARDVEALENGQTRPLHAGDQVESTVLLRMPSLQVR